MANFLFFFSLFIMHRSIEEERKVRKKKIKAVSLLSSSGVSASVVHIHIFNYMILLLCKLLFSFELYLPPAVNIQPKLYKKFCAIFF